jgi:hypothetical protein
VGKEVGVCAAWNFRRGAALLKIHADAARPKFSKMSRGRGAAKVTFFLFLIFTRYSQKNTQFFLKTYTIFAVDVNDMI